MTLEAIQALAPDQGSLVAAGKLLQQKHWLSVARAADSPVIWGECQGSGANPYRVVADVLDQGYKCSCPSRKFPCKHSLALMWQFVESAARFEAKDVPDWVQEWQGRRRRTGAPAATSADRAKDIGDAQAGASPAPEEQAAQALKREQTSVRRQAQTLESVRDGAGELQQWIEDQLRTGVAGLLDDAVARCRRIAARLVDSKAAALASRVDEWPARVLALPRELRAEAAMLELGQWVLLLQAWLAAPDDHDARAAMIQSPTREAVLGMPEAARVRSVWEVMGHSVETRRDGMVSQSTWLLDVCSEAPRFALLLDFFPASAGRRGAAFAHGQRLHAELAYYPSRYPMRAVIAEHFEASAPVAWLPVPLFDPLAEHRRHLASVPWAIQTPLRLGAGQLIKDARQQLWWSSERGVALRVVSPADDLLWRSLSISGAVVIWDGLRARLIQIETPLGRAYPDD